MKREDLLEGVRSIVSDIPADYGQYDLLHALEAVIDLHKPSHGLGGTVDTDGVCLQCSSRKSEQFYPCPTIKAIVGAMYDA